MTAIIPRITDYMLTSAGERPVTSVELAAQLKIDSAMVTPADPPADNPDYDAELVLYLESVIDSAVATGEAITKRTFSESEFEAFLDGFIQGQSYEVRKCPLVSVDEISRVVNGVVTVIDAGDYYATQSRGFSRLASTDGKSWPNDSDRRMQAVKVTLTAGYGDTWAMPADLKQAILSHAAFLYANRGDCTSGEAASASVVDVIPPCARAVYERYKIRDLFMGI